MITKIRCTKEVELKHIEIEVNVRYGEEDMPNDFPFRKGDLWQVIVDIDSGKIVNWPVGVSGDVYMKVCDEGCYRLLDADGKTVLSIEQNYVPHGIVPGKYGDYIDLKINGDGVITNWPKKPNLDDFETDEEY